MNCLFTVIEKKSVEWGEERIDCSSKAVSVYNVRTDKTGFPHFLIYEDGQWKYKSAKLYRPMEVGDKYGV